VKQALALLALLGCSTPPPSPDRTASSEVCEVLARSTAFPIRVAGYRGLRAQCCEQDVQAACRQVHRAFREHSDPAAVEGVLGPNALVFLDNTRACKHLISEEEVAAFLMDDRMARDESVRALLRSHLEIYGLLEPEILLLEASRPNPERWESLVRELATLSDRDLRRLEPMLSNPDPVVRALAARAISNASIIVRLELETTEAALARLASDAPSGALTGVAAKAHEASELALFQQRLQKSQTPDQAVERLQYDFLLLGRRRATCGATNLDWALGELRESRFRTLDDWLADPIIARVLAERKQLCPDESR
jgi:hypothetical protein